MATFDPQYPVCNDCMDAAYDLGATDRYTQIQLCVEIGAELIDHTCITVEEPDSVKCACMCSKNKPNAKQMLEYSVTRLT